MANNEFLIDRVVKADVSFSYVAATQAVPTGVYLPAGALVTGVTMVDFNANTVANASQSIDLRAGAVALISTTMVKDIVAQTACKYPTLAVAGGVFLTKAGEIVLSVQGSTGTNAFTCTPSIFVGYNYLTA